MLNLIVNECDLQDQRVVFRFETSAKKGISINHELCVDECDREIRWMNQMIARHKTEGFTCRYLLL